MRGACGGAGMRDGVAAFRAGRDIDVKEAAVDPDFGLFGGDIGGRTIDADGSGLHHARCDERDISAARVERIVGVDRSVDGDCRCAARGAVEADRAAGAEQPAGGNDIVGGQHQASDVDHTRRADQDAAGVIEPDVAAASARCEEVGRIDGSVERDLATQRAAAAVYETVEDGIVAAAAEIPILPDGKKIDRAAGRCAVGRDPIDDALGAVDIDCGRVGPGIAVDRAGARCEAAGAGNLRQRRSAIRQCDDARGDRATGQQALLAFANGRERGRGTHVGCP